MTNKEIIFLLLNFPLIYLMFAGMGWIMYFMVHGNPAQLIPLRYLLLSFGIITILLDLFLLNLFRLFSRDMSLIVIIQVYYHVFRFMDVIEVDCNYGL